MASFFKRNEFKSLFIYFVVLIVSLLLFINILLINKNNEILEYSRKLQEQTERVKLYTLDIIRNGHQLDMGLRGLALIDTSNNENVFKYAFFHKEEIFDSLEVILSKQNFPREEFKKMRDSTNEYFRFSKEMRQLLKDNKRAEFISKLKEDRGYTVWLTYRDFAAKINQFEDRIATEAQRKYEQALQNSFLLQIVLFLIAVPTLLYTAYFSNKALIVSGKLARTEQEKNQLLEKQKGQLEQLVQERTDKILKQNEEIILQNNTMSKHNKKLVRQQIEIETRQHELTQQNVQLKVMYRIIEKQNQIIQGKNDELSAEVLHQTQDLRKANTELIEHNSRLEQFAYIISHNLRAPMARLVGLSSLLDLESMENERTNIIELMVKSTSELDNVIKDLSLILGIQKLSTQVYSEIQLEQLVQKTKDVLEQDIKETQAEIATEFAIRSIYSLPQYVESIFYNLISNAIKYRQPEKKPVIKIRSYTSEHFILIEFSDKGLGIDINKHKGSLFSLYKRFHFHVEGKGLGLYLVKTQIESLGGTIDVRSQINEGTTFIISIPVN